MGIEQGLEHKVPRSPPKQDVDDDEKAEEGTETGYVQRDEEQQLNEGIEEYIDEEDAYCLLFSNPDGSRPLDPHISHVLEEIKQEKSGRRKYQASEELSMQKGKGV